MKKSFRFFVVILIAMIGICSASAQDEIVKKKVAVYMTGSDVDSNIKKVIGAKLVSAITQSGEYAAVERTADFLAALSAESDYQTGGEVRDSQIVQLGQRFGVRYVVVADVSEVFDEYFISSRIINVETGLVERAVDVNGPAETMNQLIKLSQEVASGLLKKVALTSVFSNMPIHMSLCVTDSVGTIQYIKTDQWLSMPDGQKLNYRKLGVCFLENGDGFLLSLHDVGTGNWYDAVHNGAPSPSQFEQISKWKNALNDALRIYGGDPIFNVSYWTSERVDRSSIERYFGPASDIVDAFGAWTFEMIYGTVNFDNLSSNYKIRTVSPLRIARN